MLSDCSQITSACAATVVAHTRFTMTSALPAVLTRSMVRPATTATAVTAATVARVASVAMFSAGGGSSPAHGDRLLALAQGDARRGDETACRERVARVREIAADCAEPRLQIGATALIGLLELGLGNIAVAAKAFEECVEAGPVGLAGWAGSAATVAEVERLAVGSSFVEALIALGDRGRAEQEGAREHRRALGGGPRVLASAARCQALLAPSDSYEWAFEDAMARYASLDDPFEVARTLLCFGERLRRERRVLEARERLSTAVAAFARMQATPWALRARRELEACRQTPRRRDPACSDELSRREREVAEIVAAGATTREAAARLFLSTKTVEAHLQRVYRKLGVHNRAQLVNALMLLP